MIAETIDLSSDDSFQGELHIQPQNYDCEKTESDTDVELPIVSTTSKSPEEDYKKKKLRKKDKVNSDGKKITAAERQALKKKLSDEKRAAKNANKMYKPGECMKHIIIEMHPVLLESWFCGDVQREASASGVKLRSSPTMSDTALVLWTRNVMPTLTNSNGLVELTPSKAKCEHGLYIYQVQDIEELVESHSLSKHMKQAMELAGCKLSLVLFGVKDYFKASARKTANSRRHMTDIELEKAVIDLLVSADCDTIIVNTPNELALTIVQFTKAIAEEPFKKAKRALDEQADFYMRGDNKKCVAVDKDGNGLGRLWQQMIAILPNSSLETSRTLCAQYKTPLALYEALQSPNGVSDLASIGVSRTAVPGAKARRIGPEFARKLHVLFAEEDGSVLLD